MIGEKYGVADQSRCPVIGQVVLQPFDGFKSRWLVGSSINSTSGFCLQKLPQRKPCALAAGRFHLAWEHQRDAKPVT